MKKLFTSFLLIVSVSAFAQSFEGTMSWSVTSEITDPALKAKMEESQKQMNSPEGQARMKEMQERMNDPKMKEMMAANPQMKAQMERSMQMAGGGGGMEAMMPKKMIYKIKGHTILTKMEGGMEMEILSMTDKNLSYRLDRANKTFTVLSTTPAADEKNPAHQTKVTKTKETTKILGYTCTKFVAETTMGEHTMSQTLWTTSEINGLDMKLFTNQKAAGGQSMYYEGLEGIPMKIEIKNPQMKIVMEVTEIKKGAVRQDEVSIPAGFTETKF